VTQIAEQTGPSAANVAVAAPSPLPKPTKFRWWILLLFSLIYLICYMDRGNLSIAAPEIARQFGLSKTAMGLVLAAFSWAYAAGQVPVGWLGDRFGPKKVLTVIMYGVGLAPILNGLALGLNTLLGARLFLGACEAGAFPVATRGMQSWFAKAERGRVQGITHFFSRLAVALTPPVSAAIMLAFGWRTVFFIFGGVGLAGAVAFHLFYCNRPEEQKRVNQGELAEIRGMNPDGSVKDLVAPSRPQVPWRQILRSPNMWAIAVGYCTNFFGANFYLTWYPTYLREYRHISLKHVGVIAALPLLAGMVGNLAGGYLTDGLLTRTGNAKVARRGVAVPGLLLAGIFVVPASLTHSPVISVLCLAASFFCLEMVVAPAWAVCMDVGGQYSGTVTAIMNCSGALASSFTPVVYGALFDRGMWIMPFFVSAGVLTSGALIWIFLINPERSVVGGA
jgi:sugar phosphate permease